MLLLLRFDPSTLFVVVLEEEDVILSTASVAPLTKTILATNASNDSPMGTAWNCNPLLEAVMIAKSASVPWKRVLCVMGNTGCMMLLLLPPPLSPPPLLEMFISSSFAVLAIKILVLLPTDLLLKHSSVTYCLCLT
jgi:hypothetical protein